MLDRDSPIPLYFQLAQIIRNQIASGDLKPGEHLPSNDSLAETYGISRMTVRQTIVLLMQEGLLITKRGVGTIVAGQKRVYDVAMLCGFVNELRLEGVRADVQVVEKALARPSLSVQSALNLGDEDQVVRIARLRLSEGVPLILETNCFVAALCPGLEDEDLVDNPLSSLREQYNLLGERVRQTLESTVSNPFESELFGLPDGSPLFLTEGVTYRVNGQPIEHFKVAYRGDLFRFQFESNGQASIEFK